jgi:hypothetical protein
VSSQNLDDLLTHEKTDMVGLFIRHNEASLDMQKQTHLQQLPAGKIPFARFHFAVMLRP